MLTPRRMRSFFLAQSRPYRFVGSGSGSQSCVSGWTSQCTLGLCPFISRGGGGMCLGTCRPMRPSLLGGPTQSGDMQVWAVGQDWCVAWTLNRVVWRQLTESSRFHEGLKVRCIFPSPQRVALLLAAAGLRAAQSFDSPLRPSPSAAPSSLTTGPT